MAQQSGHFQVVESLTPRQQRSMLVGVLVLVALVMGVVNTIANGDTDWRGLVDNFSTELLGAALTFFIFDLFQERRSNVDLKKRLTSQIRSGDKRRAQHAIEELRLAGWLTDGSLRDGYFQDVRLRKGVDLRGAKLAQSNWAYAFLKQVNLENVNFQDADLGGANFIGANLRGANLEGVNLTSTKVTSIKVVDNKLEHIELVGTQATFDENTILPDDISLGKRSFWTPETDITRFTNPNHPDFWRSNDPKSPAYRGDDKA